VSGDLVAAGTSGASRERNETTAVTGSIRGRDGSPLESATVTLVDRSGTQLGRSTVDAGGRFTLAVPGPGAVTMIVAAPGSVPMARSVSIPRHGMELGAITLGRPGDAATPRTGRWVIDPAHSTIGVTGQHLGLSKVHGRFQSFSGEIVVRDLLEGSTCEARIDADSIDTGNAQRDDHLRSADFLDVAVHPVVGYRSTGIEPAGPGRWVVHGRLDLAGVVRDVPLDLRYSGTRPDPWGGVRAGFTAAAQLNREDFRMNWNQAVELGLSLIGAQLLVELDIQAVLAD
jgi:polyisoprenoid-binding protein YceI